MEKELLLDAGKLSQAWALLSGGERQRAIIACALVLVGVTRPPSTDGESSGGSMSRSLDGDDAGDSAVEMLQSARDDCEEGADPEADPRDCNWSDVDADSRPYAVLLLDEPTAACDAVSCAAVERAIVASGSAVILITHDEQQARRLAHRRINFTPC